MATPEVSELIQLVGSNPLPCYISATTLRPRVVHLVFTKESEPVAGRLRNVYKSLGIDTEFVYIEDATSPLQCEKAISGKMERSFLDYTGGTKVMAVNVYASWLRRGGELSRACYVDTPRGVLRFNNGNETEITTDLSLDLLVRLHGFKLLKWKKPATNPSRLRELEQEANSFLDKLECDESLGSAYDGHWLEELVTSLIVANDLADKSRTMWNVEVAPRHGPKMEIDAVAIVGHRTFVLSCTTSGKYSVSKNKAFEVILRSQQIAGRMAKAALLSPLDIVPASQGGLTDQGFNLETTVRSHWNDPVAFRVFTRSDLQEWVGHGGIRRSFRSLTSWIRM